MSSRWDHFDGVKAFAIFVVIASHTAAFGLYGQGSIIVSLFLVMSGFFVVFPMKDDGEEAFASVKGWLRYYILRFVRIVPLYWFVVLFFYWISDTAFADKRVLLENLLFYNTYGHLWYIQHAMACYLVAPVFLLIVHGVKKIIKVSNWSIGVCLFLIGMAMSKFFFTTAYFCLLWSGEKRQWRLGLFVMGMGIGYVIKSLRHYEIKNTIIKIIMDIGIVGIMLLETWLTSEPVLVRINPVYEDYYYGWYHPITCAVMSSIMVFLLAWNCNGYVAKVLQNKVLVKIGQMSLGIYLIHNFLLEFLPMTPIKKFVMAAIISGLAAKYLYEKIEEPMYRRVKSILNRW